MSFGPHDKSLAGANCQRSSRKQDVLPFAVSAPSVATREFWRAYRRLPPAMRKAEYDRLLG